MKEKGNAKEKEEQAREDLHKDSKAKEEANKRQSD
jgi:hypothetical protein